MKKDKAKTTWNVSFCGGNVQRNKTMKKKLRPESELQIKNEISLQTTKQIWQI